MKTGAQKILILYFLCLSFSMKAQRNTIDISSELEQLSDFSKLPVFRENTRIHQFSSYDTTGGNDDGFSGKYSFIRKNADSSLVIFEAIGKGVINRMWTPTPTEDTLDFFFDGQKKPGYSIKFSDLFSGKVEPFMSPLAGNEIGGFYNYFPIPFSKGLKIVSRGKNLQFYQIQYRSLPKNYKVVDFSEENALLAREKLEELREKWENPEPEPGAHLVVVDTLIKSGQQIKLASIGKGGRIHAFKIFNAEAFTGLYSQIDLKITWDNEKEPAIYMPLADFFGYAFGEVSMQSLLVGTKDNINYSYFPMPFDRAAEIEVIFRKTADSEQENIPVKLELSWSEDARDPKTEGKFYAFWNSDFDPSSENPHTFLSASGKGHYVGTILQAQGLNPGMTLFFEGDDVTRIDGEELVHGTGSEDYFNGGWYALLNRWDRKISLPLHGSLDYSLPFARTGGYRLFLIDKMPFNKSIEHTIEHGPENNNMPVDYTSVAFYYADGPLETSRQQPANELTKVYVPEVFMIYPQLMKYSVGGIITIDGSLLEARNGGEVRIDFSEIPNGHYKLYADIEKFPEGAEISIWQRQKILNENVSFYASENTTEPEVYLTDIAIDDFRKTITIRFNNEKERNKIRINRLILKAI